MNQIYENIRARRLELGMSQEKLAELCGYKSRSIICDIEKGRIDLPYDRILTFAKVLKVQPEDLMGYTDPEDDGVFLADLSVNKTLLNYVKKIASLSPDKQAAVFTYVDFVEASDKKPE